MGTMVETMIPTGGRAGAAAAAEVVLRSADRDLGRDDVDDAATPAAAELDRAGDEGEQGVVTAATDVQAGVEVGAALADDDLAGVDDLAAEALDAEPLRVGVAPVAGGRGALLVSHRSAFRVMRVWVGGEPECYLEPVSMPVTLTCVCFCR